jgi:hypothetical protein
MIVAEEVMWARRRSYLARKSFMVVIKLLIEDLKLRMAVLNLRRVDEDERCCFRER